MRTFCELYVKTILPVLRMIVARELITNYSLSQMEAAKVLGITQASINYYIYGRRCSKLLKSFSKIPEIRKAAHIVSEALVKGRKENISEIICELCRTIRRNKEYLNIVLNIMGIEKINDVLFPHENGK